MYDYYGKALNQVVGVDYSVEHILSENFATTDNSLDYRYLIPNQFVKGYIDISTGEVVKNPDFNGGYKSEVFDGNLEKVKGGK